MSHPIRIVALQDGRIKANFADNFVVALDLLGRTLAYRGDRDGPKPRVQLLDHMTHDVMDRVGRVLDEYNALSDEPVLVHRLVQAANPSERFASRAAVKSALFPASTTEALDKKLVDFMGVGCTACEKLGGHWQRPTKTTNSQDGSVSMDAEDSKAHILLNPSGTR